MASTMKFLSNALLILVAAFSIASAMGDDYVVVGAKADFGSEVSDVNELRAVFMGEKLFWSDNERIFTILPDFNHASTAAFAQEVLGVDRQQYLDYWRRKLFAGKGHPPRETESDAEALGLLRANPGSVAILSHEPKDSTGLVVLKVDPRSNRLVSAGL